MILAGRPTGPATRSCVAGNVDAVLAVRWPDSCRIEPATGTGAGRISQAICRMDKAGNRVVFRREVQGGPGVGLKIMMTTHVIAASGISRVGQDITTTAGISDPVHRRRRRPSRPDTAAQ